MKRYFILIIILLFMLGCSGDDSKNIESSTLNDLQSQAWLFGKQYIRSIDGQSWEKLSISALNNYKDIKIDLTYIDTGKSQNCGLYAKGVMIQEAQNNKEKKHKKKFLFRPNLIPQITIIITKQEDNSSSFDDYTILLEVSDISEFIRICGYAHQYIVGEYSLQ